jgi:outer membrane protein assembly factor BamD
MHRPFLQSKFKITTLLLLFSISLFAGCTTVVGKENIPPDQLLVLGKQFSKKQEYFKAQGYFKQVLEDFPDSKERVSALMLLAHTLYLDQEYEEAQFHFKKFIELYPAKSYVDRAYFYRAMCDFRIMEIATRDQTNTHAAIEGFDEFIRKFPKSPFYPKAVEKKYEAIQVLAQSVFEIGKFYYRTGAYQAAISRLENVRETYPKHGFIEEATFLIAESYYEEENFNKAKDTYKELLIKYPKGIYSVNAKVRLQKLR